MNRIHKFRGAVNLALVTVSAVLLAVALAAPKIPGDTDAEASRVQKRLERRLGLLESYVGNPKRELPPDMVIYRYESDSLVEWHGQFPVVNDNISQAVMFQALVSPRASSRTPLAEVRTHYDFFNFGDSWYLVRKIQDQDTYIVGLFISDMSDPVLSNGVNGFLRLGQRFSIKPLSFNGGSAVSVNGTPVFKVLNESLAGSVTANPLLLWLSLLFFSCALFLILRKHRTRRAMFLCLSLEVAAIAIMFIRELGLSDGPDGILPGAITLLNILFLAIPLFVCSARKDILSALGIGREHPAVSAAVAVSIVFILLYIRFSLSAIIGRSDLFMDMFRFGRMSLQGVLIVISYFLLLFSLPLLLKLRFEKLSRGVNVCLSALLALYFVWTVSSLVHRMESSRMAMTAGILELDRDSGLERRLHLIEQRISDDAVISSLSFLDNSESAVRNRISDNYAIHLSGDYDFSVFIISENFTSLGIPSLLPSMLETGTPILPQSHFLYSDIGRNPVYIGLFPFYDAGRNSTSQVVLMFERRFGAGSVWKAVLPPQYSYARYRNGELRSFRGDYAYPTVLEGGFEDTSGNRFVHFVNHVDGGDIVIISRPGIEFSNYLVAWAFLALLLYVVFVLAASEKRSDGVRRNYYNKMLTRILLAALVLTLVSMTAISVLYIYRSNNSNLSTIMSERIGTLQQMVQNGLKGKHNSEELYSPETTSFLESVCASLRVSVDLFSDKGKLISRAWTGRDYSGFHTFRIDEEAYDMIVRHHARYYVQRERGERLSRYWMYAPILSDDGSVIAIISAPYNGVETLNMERDAIVHLLMMITLFFILTLLSLFFVDRMLSRLFGPLREMGSKMRVADLDSLEHISYSRDDEISVLVAAYNNMVDKLRENSAQLASAERNQAWTEMARQVAHEIKNPLTPMNLQIQRLIRMKGKGDPQWIERFDEVSALLLEHINILTETANEFSNFAKLYSEEHTEIDLYKVLQDELAMFEGRDDVRFEFIGLPGSVVNGPKPQLTRVFVNLINNAVQSVETGPVSGDGGPCVMVSLRKSLTDGFFDIVVEDNGPGVSEENRERLFTPNFTTKSGGTGLGLAISKSVLDSCGATIRYSRSFALGGACFTITYPGKI